MTINFCSLLWICALLLGYEPQAAVGANILGLMGVPSPSHYIWNSALLHRLAESGHNVTILSVDIPKPTEHVPSNAHYIHLEQGYSMYSNDLKFDITHFIGTTAFELIELLYDFGHKATLCNANSTGMQVLLNYPDDFKVDLIFYDYTLGPMLLGFVHKFGYPPTVGLSPFLNPPNTVDAMFSHIFPAYVPFHSTNYSSEMNFWQRMHNTFLFAADIIYRRWIYYPKINAIMRPYFSKDMPLLEDLAKHTVLSMVNSHPVLTGIEAVPMNVVEVGGLHVRDVKRLPSDFEEFINKSRNGVVVVSFGTNMKSTDFTEGQITVILDAMTQLSEYDFIWKFDANHLKHRNLPKNILARTFLPQGDLLAHPKIKVFVTHCGALSTYESIWHGVPMIGVPLFYDQYRNIRHTVQLGIAVELDFITMTTQQFRDAIKRVMEDRQMAAKARMFSSLFRDQPMKPIDRAVWWSEYLLRNPNPSLLKSPAARLNTFQANSLDVLFVWWTLLILLSALAIKLLSSTLHRFTGPIRPPVALKSKTN